MMWRIYRLPGSREIWHIDAGNGMPVFNVRGYECNVPSASIDVGGNNIPRAWIALQGDLHIVNGIAVFSRIVVTEKMENPVMACCGKIIDLGKENC